MTEAWACGDNETTLFVGSNMARQTHLQSDQTHFPACMQKLGLHIRRSPRSRIISASLPPSLPLLRVNHRELLAPTTPGVALPQSRHVGLRATLATKPRPSTITRPMIASKAQQIKSYRIVPQRRRTDEARQTDRQHGQRGYDDYSLPCMLLLLFNIHLTPMMVRTAPFECRCCRPCRRENQLSTWEAQSVERECGSVLSSDQSVVLSSSLLLPRLLPSLSCWADDRVALPCPPLSRSLLMKAHAEPPPLRGALPRVRNYYIKVKRSVLLLKPTGAI
ncbi:hypothetical protein IWX46DRAFT_267107 [Phyllosticta citricarpa]|uniref:Uncharacterized protein n=1 Tax=Phyllosticta citricarpa TaxID=55181 RepID=A0ABR1LMR6_9PEZI